MKDFEEFWPFYLSQHTQPLNRKIHFWANNLGLAMGAVLIVCGYAWYLPLVVALAYGIDWFGHFFVERNLPATFRYPLWSFRADWRMWWRILRGKPQT